MASRSKTKRRMPGAKRAERERRPGSRRVRAEPSAGNSGQRPGKTPRDGDGNPARQGGKPQPNHPPFPKAQRQPLAAPSWVARMPLAALGEALEEVFLSRHVLTRQGWRPAEEQRDARQRLRPTRGAAGRPAPNPWRPLADEVMALHEAYTEREGEFARDRNPIHHRIGGYQFYYLPRNLMRVLHVLEGLPWRAVNPEVRVRDLLGAGPFRVADLGCGSGAFSLAVLAWIAASGARPQALPPLEFVLVDQSRALLDIAQANVEEYARRTLPGLRFTVGRHAEGVSRFLDRPAEAKGRFDLVGAAMALNELGLVGADRRLRAPRTLERITALTAPGGVLLAVEPGTHEGYLNTMAVREALRAGEAAWDVLYPCPHAEACPMLEDAPRRWCHATLGLPEPFLFDEPLRKQGHLPLTMRELNLSGLVLQAPGAAPEGPFLPRQGARAVSNRLPGRGALSQGAVVLLCEADGRLHERPAEALGTAGRGDWVPSMKGRMA